MKRASVYEPSAEDIVTPYGGVRCINGPPVEYAPFKLECVVIAVNRALPLEIFLSNNARHFDNILVVTSAKDLRAQELAKQHHVSVLVTDRFWRDGNTFDLGAPYERALKQLVYNDWVLFVGADILLHRFFRAHLSRMSLNRDALYGCDRINVNTAAEIKKLEADILDGPQSTNEWGYGYFQLWNRQSRFLAGRDLIYPSHHDGSFSDALFRMQFGGPHYYDGVRWQWDNRYQMRLDMPCYHLGSPGIVYDTIAK